MGFAVNGEEGLGLRALEAAGQLGQLIRTSCQVWFVQHASVCAATAQHMNLRIGRWVGADVQRAAGSQVTPCEAYCWCGKGPRRKGASGASLEHVCYSALSAGEQGMGWHAEVESSSCLGVCCGGRWLAVVVSRPHRRVVGQAEEVKPQQRSSSDARDEP